LKISNFRLGIGLPLSYHMIPSAFFDSFISMEKPPFVYLRTSNGPIDEMRNAIVKDAFESNCTHLIMMDTDQVYDPKTIPRLLSHNLPIVGCLVYRRYPPFDPLMLRGEMGKYQTVEEWDKDALVEVDATGTGCLLFDMEVFRKMPAPWFRARREPETGKPIGEDIGFCSELRAAGYKVFVDTAVPAGHLSQMQITDGSWRLYRRLNELSKQEDAHRVEHGVVVAVKT